MIQIMIEVMIGLKATNFSFFFQQWFTSLSRNQNFFNGFMLFRYARGFVPCNNFAVGTCSVLQPSHMRYDGAFSQMGYRSVDRSTLNVFGAVGCSQTSPSAVYVQWPTPAMTYAQSYEHFRHAVFQVRNYAPVFCNKDYNPLIDLCFFFNFYYFSFEDYNLGVHRQIFYLNISNPLMKLDLLSRALAFL